MNRYQTDVEDPQDVGDESGFNYPYDPTLTADYPSADIEEPDYDVLNPPASDTSGYESDTSGLQGYGDVDASDFRQLARQNAQREGFDPRLFERLIDQESGFNPAAHNDQSGAEGIAQIVPHYHPEVDATDPQASLAWAARWLTQLTRQYGGDVRLALAHYNGGGGAVAALQRGQPYGETQQYLRAILGSAEAPWVTSTDFQNLPIPPMPEQTQEPPPPPPPGEGTAPDELTIGGGGSEKVTRAAQARYQADFRAGLISAQAYQQALVKAGVDPALAEQLVARDVAIKAGRKPPAVKVPKLDDALNAAAIQFAGTSWDAMGTQQRRDFRTLYELLDAAAIATYHKGYRYLSGDQRAGLDLGGGDPIAVGAAVTQAASQYRIGQLDLKGFTQALLGAGVNPNLVHTIVDREAPAADAQLIKASAQALGAQFRAGQITKDQYQSALVQAGVRPAIAEQWVNREAANELLRQLPIKARQQAELLKQQMAVPKPMRPAPTQRTPGPTWAKAVSLLESGDLEALTDAWSANGNGTDALNPLRWRELQNMFGANSVPALAAQLKNLWLAAGAVRHGTGTSRGPSLFTIANRFGRNELPAERQPQPRLVNPGRRASNLASLLPPPVV